LLIEPDPRVTFLAAAWSACGRWAGCHRQCEKTGYPRLGLKASSRSSLLVIQVSSVVAAMTTIMIAITITDAKDR
jgi:hypothetical protein